jgi:tRNA U55 pseudouridine synthase TruB
VACSKGTYVRSLVADLGTAVGAGAHLAELRRTRSGRFTIEQAVALDRLGDAQVVLPEHALELARVTVPGNLVAPVLSGTRIPTATWGIEVERFQLVDEEGRLLAIAHAEDGRTVYDRVFPELVRAAPEGVARAAGRRGSGRAGA